MTSRIIVSFPEAPDAYRVTTVTSWAQIAYHVYKYIAERHSNTYWIPFDERPMFSPTDVLVTCVPNPNLSTWKRSVLVDNDTLAVDKWKHGSWNRYGVSYRTDHPFRWNSYIQDCLAVFIKTNDIAIQRWNTNDAIVAEKKAWLQANVGHVELSPHPIDKAFFGSLYDPSALPAKRMLVCHGGWRKNGKELLQTLQKMGYRTGKDYDIMPRVNKMNLQSIKLLLSGYAYFAHTSVSEGFPYLANEFMCQGMILYGHEDWWDGQGDQRLRWTYDPSRQTDNEKNLRTLLSKFSDRELRVLRESQQRLHMDRKDNTWDCFGERLWAVLQTHL